MNEGAQGTKKKKKKSDLPRVGISDNCDPLIWGLGVKLSSSVRAAYDLNH